MKTIMYVKIKERNLIISEKKEYISLVRIKTGFLLKDLIITKSKYIIYAHS